MAKIRHCEELQYCPVELFPGLQTNTEREPQTNAARYSDGPSYADIYEDMFGRSVPHSVRVRLNGDSDGGDLRQVKSCPQTNGALDSDDVPSLEHVKAMILNREEPEVHQDDDGGDVPSAEEIRKQILGR